MLTLLCFLEVCASLRLELYVDVFFWVSWWGATEMSGCKQEAHPGPKLSAAAGNPGQLLGSTRRLPFPSSERDLLRRPITPELSCWYSDSNELA